MVEGLKRVKCIREKNINWSTFKKYFKKKFLSEQYYEERAKEFYELKLGTMNMKELNIKFLSLLRMCHILWMRNLRYNGFSTVYIIDPPDRNIGA